MNVHAAKNITYTKVMSFENVPSLMLLWSDNTHQNSRTKLPPRTAFVKL